MLNINDITITSLDIITAYELTGLPAFILDELQDTQISNTQEKEDIVGKQGRKLNSLKRNKACTVSGTNGMLSAGMLEAQTGSNFVHDGAAIVDWSESLMIASNEAATSYVATGTAGAEITALYIKDATGAAQEKLEQAAQAAAGKFAYNPSTKKLTFLASAYPDNTEIIVFYRRKLAADVLSNKSDNYSKKLRLVIDATAEDKCSNVYHLQIEIPKADFSGDFDVQMGDSQAVHAFEAESLVNTANCGSNKIGGNLWNWTIFGANAADVQG